MIIIVRVAALQTVPLIDIYIYILALQRCHFVEIDLVYGDLHPLCEMANYSVFLPLILTIIF